MHSSGVNALIAAHQAHGPTGRVRLAGVRGPVLRILEIVGLTTLSNDISAVSGTDLVRTAADSGPVGPGGPALFVVCW
ncbi:hypothetical protein ABZ079_23900 [Streptomyces sp. NPDC006314]|uniref:hypothetical protein n=1 Tax=Streptomyces sp. NPDC006314 TaxID=3154475 RepID=UPI0033BB8ED6